MRLVNINDNKWYKIYKIIKKISSNFDEPILNLFILNVNNFEVYKNVVRERI